uniref:Uncharacterized protein n=1 Tax=Fagus sylvatica TaxID=28930 RepID=A0A2N9G3A5_FAGSY
MRPVTLLLHAAGCLVRVVRFLPLPEGALCLIAATAFCAEYLLFCAEYPSTSHKGLEGHYHLILVLLIGLCILSTVAGALLPSSFPVDLCRGIAIALQGLWFYQTAFTLYGPMMPEGCRLKENQISCHSKDSEVRGELLANFQLFIMVLGVLVAVVGSYGFAASRYGHSELRSLHAVRDLEAMKVSLLGVANLMDLEAYPLLKWSSYSNPAHTSSSNANMEEKRDTYPLPHFCNFSYIAMPAHTSSSNANMEEKRDTQEGKSEEEDMYEKVLEKEPRNVEALKVVLFGKMRRGETKEALKCVERLVDEEPDEVEWRLLKALCYETMGKLRKAKRLYKEILKERPLLLTALHVYNQSLMYRINNNFDCRLIIFCCIVQLHMKCGPRLLGYLVSLGLCLGVFWDYWDAGKVGLVGMKYGGLDFGGCAALFVVVSLARM